jgi:hypothetical protein
MSEEKQDLRTKVSIGTGSIFNSSAKFVMAYKPEEDQSGNIHFDQNGNVTRLVRLGGVKVGTEGRIIGPPLKAPKSFLAEYEKQAGSLGLDLIEMIPVDLTEYKQMAWFPSHMVRVVG